MRLSVARLIAISAFLAVAAMSPASAGAATSTKHVSGWALTGPTSRIVGGEVRVRSLNGRDLVLAADRGTKTSKTGTFSVRTLTLPKRYLVTVTGGRVRDVAVPGTLRTLVTRSLGHPLTHVTPLTTLVAARVRHHGSIARATLELRSYLKIPAAHDLYVDLRRDGSSFDGVMWLQTARRAGGVATYAAQTARQLGGKPRPMRPRVLARAAQAEAEEAEVAVQVVPDSFAKTLLNGALRQVGSTAMGHVLSGLGFGDGAALAQISSQLKQLQQDMNNLNVRVEQISQQVTDLQAQVAQSNYSELTSNLGVTWVGDGANDAILSNLTWLADHAGGCDDTTFPSCIETLPPGTDASVWCTQTLQKTPTQATACQTLRAIETLRDGNDAKALQGRLIGDQTADGVLQAYQKAAYAKIRATNGGDFITPSYLAGAQTVQTHYAWITVLIAHYGMEYDTSIGLPDDRVAQPIQTAITNSAAQTATLPQALPERTVIHTRTGRVWKLLKNDTGACGAKPGWLAFNREFYGKGNGWIPRPCWLWFNQQMGAMGPPGGGEIPTKADLQDMFRDRTGTSLHNWLRDYLGMPDLNEVSTAFVIPPPDISLFGYTDPSPFFENPGTNFGLGTSTCTTKVWLSSSTISNDYNQVAMGPFCDYVDLNTGATRSECMHAWDNKPGGYYPCSMPVYRRTLDGYGSISAPLDYGHPSVWMLWRPVSAADSIYYRK